MSYVRKPDGTVVVTVRFTFHPQRDVDHIAMVEAAHPDGPDGRAVSLSSTMREAMRSGIVAGFQPDAEDDINFGSFGFDL